MDKKDKFIIILSSACITLFIVVILLLLNYVATWDNASFWGGVTGAVLAGGATITVFLVTTKESKRQFNTLLLKEKPILEFTKVKYMQRQLPYLGEKISLANMVVDFSTGEEYKDTQTIVCSIKNSGKSTAENVKIKCKAKYNIVGQVIVKEFNDFHFSDFLIPDKTKSYMIEITTDNNVASYLYIIVSGTYANMEIKEQKKILYYPNVGWLIDRD